MKGYALCYKDIFYWLFLLNFIRVTFDPNIKVISQVVFTFISFSFVVSLISDKSIARPRMRIKTDQPTFILYCLLWKIDRKNEASRTMNVRKPIDLFKKNLDRIDEKQL